MIHKVKVRFQDADEVIDLIEEPYDNKGALLFFYHDSNGNYLEQYLAPHDRVPAQSISTGVSYRLGEKIVTVVKKDGE